MNINYLNKHKLIFKPRLEKSFIPRYSIIFNRLRNRELLITHKTTHKSLYIKQYRTLSNTKFFYKNKIGTILLNILNNSNQIIQLLESYKPLLNETYVNGKVNSVSYYMRTISPILFLLYKDLLEINPNTLIMVVEMQNSSNKSFYHTVNRYNHRKLSIFQNKPIYFDHIIEIQIRRMRTITKRIDEIYKRTPKNKKGYVTYNNPIVYTPKCQISFKKLQNKNIPYLYEYKIDNLEDLFASTVYSLSLVKYKIYKCDICGRYFTSKKTRKTCSNVCENKSIELRKEKNRNRNNKNSDAVNILYRRIRNFYNKTVINKNKQSLKDKMRKDFEARYDKKIIALNKQYSSSLDYRYQNQLLIWLENEYKRIQKTFPSKKFGNTNRSIT